MFFTLYAPTFCTLLLFIIRLFFSLEVLPTVSGSYLGCLLVKKLNKITFDKLMVENPGDIGRSMVTRDMLDNIGTAFYYLTK